MFTLGLQTCRPQLVSLARQQACTIDPCADRCRLAPRRMSGENSTTGSTKLARPNSQGSKLRFRRDKTRNFISDKTKGSSLSSAATTQSSSAASPPQHADGGPFDDNVSSDAASGCSDQSRWPTPDSPAGPVCKADADNTDPWLATPLASVPVPSACVLLACRPLARGVVGQFDKLVRT